MATVRLGILLNVDWSRVLLLNQPRKKIGWFLLSAVILVLDQLTKQWASAELTLRESINFLPYFNFTLLHNYGAAFSFLADQGGWQRLFFGVVAAAISLLLVFWILRLESRKRLELAGLSLVLGGAIGNLWDRIVLGYVVDFVDWFYMTADSECLPFFYSMPVMQSCHWPAFNIADAAILLGVACLLIDALFSKEAV